MIYNSDIMNLPISGKAYWNGSITKDATMTAYGAIGYVPIQVGNAVIYRLFTELSPDCVADKSLPIKFAYKDSDPFITHSQLVSIQRQLCNFLCRKLIIVDPEFTEDELTAFDNLPSLNHNFFGDEVILLADLRR